MNRFAKPVVRQWGWLVATAVLTILTFAIVLHTLQSDTGLSNRQALGLALAQGLALLIAVRVPHAAWVISAGATALCSVWVDAGLWVDPMFNSHLAVLALIAFGTTPRIAAGYWCVSLVLALGLTLALRPPDAVAGSIELAVLAGLALVAGGASRALLDTRRTLRRQRDAVDRERERGALLEERARIARELHDVVAHHMSVIAIQAEAIRVRDPAAAPSTLAGLDTIRDSAVTALGEMRRILGVLRSGETGLLPQPTLTDIDALIDSVRAAGTPVDCAVTGDPAGLPPGLGLSAYRIVQEASSNALRHAPGAPLRIVIDIAPERIRIRIDNEIRRHAGTASGAGQGLPGMRERVTLLGGTFHAAPDATGMFRVAVSLPIGEPKP
ncbi:histidine kinase [Nocardia sp. NPDC005978]|uniref:sensor histidine kinase n=1 Tax=Nocardia sp. NPDC005978 TaxID=3156725 RepID=UPI0033A745A2